ncbi:2-oxoacid:acceptor oxidoreductase family protein [Syntrophus aciditrophicus]|jgi:2-oxoglutarate ferredoxin oxidoreductase subunit gamma|uniref:Pyruvate:ferredoxin oxidoreductase and related 2-oxoacid:ferredoxin oxidoreductases, gamma subunit n=1 Tax=Syntrophus aciditrophicus (strain SB) TaxID=56780 RepID=Q2LW35_SYNAS|nr:2-oxoacid:acceptor oxidoreductase family protein [Syntrophus aciditrophicus]ABC78293.1 pyruvate:ferredoxin oxidoreductase and related 2-oxoacid:ferredoxin oxidoreductases, gamma subunit [Syntrophus aciditrophicus SB]
MRYDIRLSGSGGQGIIVMGIVLAEAIGVYDGKHVAQTQSYGPQSRGGSSKAEIVVSDEEIDYPEAMKLDLLLAMNQISCDEYYTDLKPEGLLIADSTFVTQLPVSRAFVIPFTRIAREKLNQESTANMIAIGTLPILTGIVSPRALERAIRERLPGAEDLNLKAMRAGMAAARKAARKAAGATRRIAWENEDL